MRVRNEKFNWTVLQWMEKVIIYFILRTTAVHISQPSPKLCLNLFSGEAVSGRLSSFFCREARLHSACLNLVLTLHCEDSYMVHTGITVSIWPSQHYKAKMWKMISTNTNLKAAIKIKKEYYMQVSICNTNLMVTLKCSKRVCSDIWALFPGESSAGKTPLLSKWRGCCFCTDSCLDRIRRNGEGFVRMSVIIVHNYLNCWPKLL